MVSDFLQGQRPPPPNPAAKEVLDQLANMPKLNVPNISLPPPTPLVPQPVPSSPMPAPVGDRAASNGLFIGAVTVAVVTIGLILVLLGRKSQSRTGRTDG
jgi:hypothetical protein